MATWLLDPAQPLLDDTFPLPLDRPFTLAQACAAGLTPRQLGTMVRAGLLRRLVKGVYVAAQVPDSRTVRARALRLLTPVGSVVTDWTAHWLWTGNLAPGDHLKEPVPSLFRATGTGDRLRNDLCASGCRTFTASDLVEVDGLVVTTPLRTAWDLGRLASRDAAIGALDAALRLGGVDKDELLDGVARFRRQRGVVQLRELAPLADPRAESPGESILRLRWHDLPSLPQPEPQVPIMVGDVLVYLIDLGVPELAYGCEYDGEEFHADVAKDDARRADLLQRFGWDVDGVRKANVHGVARDIERVLYDGIARARRTLRGRRR